MEQTFALNKIYLAWRSSFGGHFEGLSRDGGAQPQHFTLPGNLQDEDLAVPRGRRQLGLAGTQHIGPSRSLPFHEKQGSPGINGGMTHLREQLERVGR